MLNRVILIGRLVADPEFRVISSGIPVANFRIAVDRNFKNAQGEIETDFITVVVWRKQAEIVSKNLQKGRLVAVDGRLQIRQYQNSEGQNRTASEVVADRVQFLDRPRSAQSGDSGSYDQTTPPPGSGEDSPASDQAGEDLPF